MCQGARFTKEFIKLCYLMHCTHHYIILYYNRACELSVQDYLGDKKQIQKVGENVLLV